MTQPSICFVAHNALGALRGVNQSHVGGIERQQALMAEWLAANGWRVTLITWGSDESPQRVKGVDIVYFCRQDDGYPILRFFWPRWTSLNAALRKADADVYYYNCGDLGLGQLALWANRHNVPYIYSVPSDPDCDPDLPALRSLRERVLYRYGLRHCEHVIVQSNVQCPTSNA